MANRLPVRRVRRDADDDVADDDVVDLDVDVDTPPDPAEWETSPGGLVAALGPVLEARPGQTTWVGWAGTTNSTPAPFEVDGVMLEPVGLSRAEVQLYYDGFCNATIWPLYHDSIIRSEYHRTWWESYQTVNRRFAERADERADDGAVVWVHDYQLQLVPALLRERRPDLRIGFFLHIPFPPVELFRQLPWRRQLLRGLAGADVVGFQTSGGAANFRALVERLSIGVIDGDDVVIAADGRRVQVRVFPIGVDAGRIAKVAADPATIERAAEIRESLGNPETILLGVDRLDYTKGIARRLEAFSELLHEERLEVPRHVFVQVAEPTREAVPGYAEIREKVDKLVSEINGAYGLVGQPAINYILRSQTLEELVALYLAADVMVVTPVRDGMNLVCKEFIAARPDDTGVLVLSEFTGAAELLERTVLVNPYDTDGLKDAIEKAATMRDAEVRTRMAVLRESVFTNDVYAWARSWMDALGIDDGSPA